MSTSPTSLKACIERADPDAPDLIAFLRESSLVDHPAGERLRRLAIAWEDVAPFSTLQRIYERAIAYDPKDAWLHASFGLAAVSHAQGTDGDASGLFDRAHAELALAAELAPDDPLIRSNQGRALYFDPRRGASDAITPLTEAIALDPREPWARLYLAHALHDLERWAEAVQAYEAVPLDGFRGGLQWRADLLIEQRGLCRLRAGDREGALTDLRHALVRYEKEPHLAAVGDARYLRDAALSELQDRVDALLQRISP